ncbi:MAG TPA: DUF4870 domain-containing protein [Thermoflexia bacterium]|nr:DUF4870 domain-containing protein [Thermoflexia bacterium]
MQPEDKSTESRLLAALAHGSITTQGLGILVGVLVYITQRDKSRYMAFQGLQAAVFQFVHLVITIGMWLFWGVLYGLSMIPMIMQMESNPDAAPPAIFWIAMLTMVIPLGYMVLIGWYGLWGAWQTWRGKDFKYLFIGRWLEKSGFGERV